MSILTITNLTHQFDSKVLFRNADLSINNGEHTGIVGLNGAGKSTFMNILCGKVIQDEGEVKWLKSIKWGYLDQHSDIDRSLSIMDYLKTSFQKLFEMNERLEDIYKQMETVTDADELDKLISRSSNLQEALMKENFYDIESDIKKVANGLGVNNLGYDTLISTLSGGQRTKVMLAGLLLQDLNCILLDEPTNYLDFEHIDWLTQYLNSYKGTVLVISHDTEFLNKVSKNIVSVENGQIKKYSGNYDSFLVNSEIANKQQLDNFKKQQQKIKKMETFIAKNKARAATAGMANSRKKMLDKMDLINKPSVIYPSEFGFPCEEIMTKDLLIVENMEIGYSNPLLPPINLHIDSSSKIWIKGTNGIGKSTLLKTLMGILPSLGGQYRFNPSVRILYLEQDLEFGNSEETATNFINNLYPRLNNKEIRNKLGKVGIKNELATKSISKLSGGEQVKVKLCALEQNLSNVLVLDEPTNHLDITAKESLAKALKEYNGAIILVTHEKQFADEVCNKVFEM